MLQSFHIENLYLLDSLAIDLKNGFVAITGESGSGKSMIIRSLLLLSGKKASTSVLREGSDFGFVEASFKLSPKQLDRLQSFYEDDSEYWILRREFKSDGRSRSFVNDSPVTNNLLGEVTDQLLRFSMQEDVGALRNGSKQLELVDESGNYASLLETVQKLAHDWRTQKNLLNTLQNTHLDDQQKNEWLKEELVALKALQYQPDEKTKLKSEREKCRHFDSVRTTYESLTELIHGEKYAVIPLLSSALNQARTAAKWDERLGTVADRLEETMIAMREIARDVDHVSSRLEGDPKRLEDIEFRLQEIAEVERKWHLDAELIAQRIEKLAELLFNVDTLDVRIREATKAIQQLEAEYKQAAELLSAQRKQTADYIISHSIKILPSLGIQQPKLAAHWTQRDEPSENGFDQLTLLFSANADFSMHPLGEVISGDELARLELALLSVCNSQHKTTLILDEIDRGVSGKIASSVGKCLKKIGLNQPVVIVTHLPQVAAAADQHISIEKSKTDQKTVVIAKSLNNTDRIDAIAAMLGGSETGQGALAGARELLTEFGNL